jgi:predicted Zn-dependent protease
MCSGIAEVVRDDAINAYADGKLVYVTTGMLRFANDEELQIVLGHEIAHNAERHIEAKQKNAGWGALLGAVADVALATQGVNTQGAYTQQFSQLAGMSFSQDFEREADYVGSYILARAKLPTDRAPLFWRRMAAESPGSIKFASSHPTSTERFVRLGQYHSEIRAKLTGGTALVPNMKKDQR